MGIHSTLPESSGPGELGAMDDDAPLSNLKNVNIKSSAVDDAGQPSTVHPMELRIEIPQFPATDKVGSSLGTFFRSIFFAIDW